MYQINNEFLRFHSYFSNSVLCLFLSPNSNPIFINGFFVLFWERFEKLFLHQKNTIKRKRGKWNGNGVLVLLLLEPSQNRTLLSRSKTGEEKEEETRQKQTTRMSRGEWCCEWNELNGMVRKK
jgi:hypothetical protein